MRRPRAVAAVAVGAAVAAVLVSGRASPASATPTPAERITVVFLGAPGGPGTVIAHGPVVDLGTLTPTDSDTDALVFPDGTLLIHETGTTVVRSPATPACIVRFTTTGTYQVVGGTGRFAGATGNGATVDSGLEVLTRSRAGCGEAALLVYDRIEIHGTLTTR